MSAGKLCFVDTNVFLYAIDESEPEKSLAARAWIDALWASGNGRISWQVLHEFYVNATRKMGCPRDAARTRVELLAVWRPVDSGIGLTRRAWEWTDTAQLSYWDALIVAAAERVGCSYLLSEDLEEGRLFGEILVVNPIKSRPALLD